MAEAAPILAFLVGGALLISALIRRLFALLHWPALIGYILLGFAIGATDSHVSFLTDATDHVFDFLAEMGIIALLFRVGVESKIKKLLNQLREASLIGSVSILLAGLLAFAAARWVFQLPSFASLLVGTALVATSVGVTAGTWREAGALRSECGQLFLDVAELDDIAGVVLMALLLALIPNGTDQSTTTPISVIVASLLKLTVILFLYGGACVLFAHCAERRITRFLARHESPTEETLAVLALGMMIAALAGLLGFSVAIGAFFAGLVFSKDPQSIKSRTALIVVYDLFTPFFFIAVGLRLRPETLGPAVVPAIVLTAAAFVGKFAGAAGPALIWRSGKTATLLGLSMIPRAEIAMVVSQRALVTGEKGIPAHIFSALVLTCLATCLIPPVIVYRLIHHWRDAPG